MVRQVIQVDGTQVAVQFNGFPLNELFGNWSIEFFHSGAWIGGTESARETAEFFFTNVVTSPGDPWRVTFDNGNILWLEPFVGALLPQNGVVLPPD